MVRISAIGADQGNASPLCKSSIVKWHAQTERDMEESGIPYTHIRPSFFMQNLKMFAESIHKEQKFYGIFGNSKIAMIDVDDIAKVVSQVIINDSHIGKAYELTGCTTYSMPDVAKHLSKTLNKEIDYIDITADQLRGNILQSGAPQWLADGFVDIQFAYRNGAGNYITNTVAAITGRQPKVLDNFLKHAFF